MKIYENIKQQIFLRVCVRDEMGSRIDVRNNGTLRAVKKTHHTFASATKVGVGNGSGRNSNPSADTVRFIFALSAQEDRLTNDVEKNCVGLQTGSLSCGGPGGNRRFEYDITL